MVIAGACFSISAQAAPVKADTVVSRDFTVRKSLSDTSKTYEFTLGRSAAPAGVVQTMHLVYGRQSQSLTNYRNNTVDWKLESFAEGSFHPFWQQSDSYPSETTWGSIPIHKVEHVVDFGTNRFPAGTRMRLSVTVATGDYLNRVQWIRVESTWKATPVITWKNPKAISYGTPLSSIQLNAKANVPGSWVYSPVVGTILSVGKQQTLNVSFTPTDTVNYNNAQKSVKIDVTPAKQTLTVNPVAGTLTATTSSAAVRTVPSNEPSVPPVTPRRNASPANPTTPADDTDIRAFYAEMQRRIEAHNVPGFFDLFTPDYLHQGQDLADQFDGDLGLLDDVESFSFDITGILVTGNDAVVSGDFTFTFDNGNAADETWPEPDLNDQTPGIGWLHRTADGWRVIGDQNVNTRAGNP